MEPQRRRFPRMGQRFQQVTHRLGWTPAGRRVMRDRLVVVLLFITVLMGPNGVLTNLPISHATPRGALGSPGQPNLFDPTQGANSVLWKPPAGRSDPNWQPPPPQTLGHTLPPSMQPGTLALRPGVDTQFLGSDGRLEVDVPGAAVSAADLTQAGGALTLQITQIAPGAGSSAGGSGLISFGTYLLQLLDSQRRRVPHGIPLPITLKWHYGTPESALNLAQAFVVFNAPLPKGVTLAPAENASVPALGTMSTQSTRLDTTAQTLTVVTPLTGPSTSISWNTDSPVATFGKPDIFNVGLNAGSLSATIPIEVPAGPGGLTPPVNLSYSSAGVSEQHNPQGAAGWVGEGWNLSLGSISWAEHNTAAGVGGTNWQDTWELNDPFGTSAQLIPPNINVSTYYDDTTHGITASPITWHTAPETHALVISYTGTVSIPGMTTNPPCFRVFLPNGIMEEFGCTPDSLQYYYSLSGTNAGKASIANWFLDLITDREGNQIHLTYTADTATDSGGHTYPRDVALSTIEWDSPGCLNAQQACTGSNWAPQMRVSFAATHGPARLTALLPGVCNTGANLRCDDPLDLSGSGGLVAPQVQSTFTLNDILVQVRPGGTGNWNTLKDYQLGYEEGGPSTVTDPMTNKQESVAGILDLTQLSVVGDDQATLEPIRLFSYTTLTEHYEDDAYTAPAGNCGPSWNSGCLLWSQSYGGDSRYLATASNGMGLLQTFTWAEARNNTHGVNGGGTNTTDPLYCNTHQTGYPCNQADDQNWSHAVLIQETDQLIRLSQQGQGGQQTSTTITSTTSYTYTLSTFSANPCSDCTQGMYWGNQNDADYLDYYNGVFQGFAQATVAHPDGSHEVHHYFATEGWGIYSTSLTCYSINPCHSDPWWDYTNALHGHEYQADYYDTDGTDLKEVQTQYNWICPPGGVNPSQSGRWNNNAVAEVDQENPIAVCDLQTSTVRTYTLDGNTTANSVLQTTTYTYDSYGRVTNQTVTSNDGGMPGSPTTIVTTTTYLWNIAVNPTANSANGTYLLDFPVFSDTEDTSGNRYSCAYTDYVTNGQGQPIWESGAQSNFAVDLVLATTRYTNCGTKANHFADASGPITTTFAYDQWGNGWVTTDPDANAGIAGHTTTCTINNGTNPSVTVPSSTCTAIDTTFRVLPTSTTNALNQAASTGYTSTAAGGFGLWPTSTTDANQQTTSVTYDGLGRMTSQTLPGETSGETTSNQTYTVFCGANMPQSPCLEVDTTERLDSTHTITTREFYDGDGRLVEVRVPGPNGQDKVKYYYYDPSGRQIFASNPYYVAAYTGAPGAAAYSIPDSTQVGTTTTYVTLRSTTVTDPLSNVTKSSSAVVCNPGGLNDSACYVQTTATDANGHQQSTLTDALGRKTYAQSYTGTSSPYQVYATIEYIYDYNGNLVQIQQPGVSTTTFTYDMAGRETGMTDPDRGTESFVYDANGNLTQSTDARGQIIYAGYDGLNRQLWRNTTNSPTGAYVTYTYDGTVPHGFPCGGIATGATAIGHVTTEQALSGPNNSFTYTACNAYNGRGLPTAVYNTINSTAVTGQTSFSYDDMGTLTQATYPNGDYEQYTYSPQEQLTTISGYNSTAGQLQVLVSGITYNGVAGPADKPDSYTLGGTNSACAAANSSIACVTLGYDADLRLTSASYSHPTNSTPITYYSLSQGYDAVGNVTNVSSTLPAAGGQSGGQDNQQFCYDALNRLTWAGDTGTNPCTNGTVTGTTLTNASYTASYQYDTANRITQSTLTGALASSPQGSYTYDSTHIHAVDAIGTSGYEAQYDASGNMTCRTVTSTQVCTSSSQTGAKFTYDVEGRLIEWDSADGTTKVEFGYTGEGARFIQQVVTNGQTTSTTYYLANEEVQAVPGQQAVVTTYFTFNGKNIAEDQAGHWYYFLSDGLGSVNVVVDATGVVAAGLFAPYGQARWAGGTMPTSYAFTGQRADATTGLDYYGARYYDPVAGTFTSADTASSGGLNRYAYVACNPETLTDPTGHDPWWEDLTPPGNGECLNDANCDNPESLVPPFDLGNPGQGTPCGSDGKATCSSGGADVSACFGKAHCIIFINGGCGPSQSGSSDSGSSGKCDGPNGTNGFGFDIGAWKKWIDALYAKYGGDVGFILMETDNSDAQQGADLIHETLSTLGAIGYTGDNAIIAASAGAAALFVYLNRADTGEYGGDAAISSFIAMDAPTLDNGYGTACDLPAGCSGDNDYQEVAEEAITKWDGVVSGAADYVRRNGISGVYAWDTNDPISSEIDGGGAWKTESTDASSDNAHTYVEGSPTSIQGVNLLDFLR